MNIPPDPETSLPTGKIPVGLLADLLSELPSSPPELLLGPRIGEDACAIRVPGGVLVAATDPITLTSDQIGRFSVIVNANDVAVMGVRPQWFLAVVLVPAGTTQATIRELFASMRRSLVQIGTPRRTSLPCASRAGCSSRSGTAAISTTGVQARGDLPAAARARSAQAIKEMAGHSSITTTFNVHGHLFDTLQERTVKEFDRMHGAVLSVGGGTVSDLR